METGKPTLLGRLPLIRLAMLMTTILVASVMLGLHQQGDLGLSFDELEPDVKMVFNLAFLGLITVVGFIVLYSRRKLDESLDDAKKAVFIILAWAAAEGVALFGAILISFGATSFFVAGMMTFAMVLMAVPVPDVSGEN